MKPMTDRELEELFDREPIEEATAALADAIVRCIRSEVRRVLADVRAEEARWARREQ